MFSKFHKLFDALSLKERQVFQSASVVFLLSFLLNGANIFYKTTILSPIEGGAYTEGLVGQPIAINPLVAGANEADRDLVSLLFSPLGSLAEDISASDDKKTWSVTLPEDLRWSDGEALTADDIVFTIATIQDPDAHSPLMNAWQGVHAVRMSAREAQITLKTPYAFFKENLEDMYIVPEHIFGAIPAANLRLSDYNLEPVGSGLYAFSTYEKRRDGFIKKYNLVANEHYAGEAPLIKNFSVSFFGSYSEAIDAFNRREIQGLGGFSPAEARELKVAHELRELAMPRYYAVFLNPAASLHLKEAVIRRALARSADKAAVIREALDGRAIPIHGPLHPGLAGYDPGAEAALSFEKEEAASLLEGAGWLKGEDGMRRKTISKEEHLLEFTMVVPDIDFLKKTAEVLIANWAEIGVTVHMAVQSPAEITNETIKDKNYEMLLFGNILKSTPDIFSFWHSSERFRSGLNLAFYENKIVDGLLESIRREFSDEARKDMLHRIQAQIVADAPAVFLFSPSYLYASPRTLGGFDERFIESPAKRFSRLSAWYLRTARVFKQ